MDEVISRVQGDRQYGAPARSPIVRTALYPAIDVNASSTRHEELLFERGQLQQVWKLRRVLNALANDGKEAAGSNSSWTRSAPPHSNDEFLAEMPKDLPPRHSTGPNVPANPYTGPTEKTQETP